MTRLESLDWLRGLLALSIMVYHLVGWTLYQPDSGELLGRLGVYGVSMFFILSGLSMAAGYHSFIRDGRSVLRFYVRRVFRIWPMLWMAVAAVTLGGVLVKHEAVDWGLVLLNLTTLFGFVDPGAYVNTGAWSIGNEMVYYALTPTLLAVYNRGTRYGNALFVLCALIGLYFGFAAITREATLAAQWQTYINPFNNLMFYVGGVALFYSTRQARWGHAAAVGLMLISIVVLAGYPARGDLVTVVTGMERIVFFVACCALVLSFYKLPPSLPAWASRPFAALGEATYGVYLLHPIVYAAVGLGAGKAGVVLPPYAVIAATIALTIVLSIFAYRYVEAPLIRLGKRLSAAPRPANALPSAP
jgi:exopolysaccharide production protein ExoZ